VPADEKRKDPLIKAILKREMAKEKKQQSTALKKFEIQFESLESHQEELEAWKVACVDNQN
jgi:hypothetical protein